MEDGMEYGFVQKLVGLELTLLDLCFWAYCHSFLIHLLLMILLLELPYSPPPHPTRLPNIFLDGVEWRWREQENLWGR